MQYNWFSLSSVAAITLISSACAAPSGSVAPGPAPAQFAGPVLGAANLYIPHRAYDAGRNRFSDFESMLSELARADVIFLGEQHDDPRTHRLQAAVLEGLARRRSRPVVVALEMFERDAQPALDAYLAGSSTEAEFLAASRPWPNYAADYRPMVEFARAQGWPVIAGNVPRRLAQAVSRAGLSVVDTLPAADRLLIAAELSCPRDEYWRRFRATMGDMGGHGMQLTPEQVEATAWRFYEAQCVKDETMGEAVAEAAAAHDAPVVHANGAFHSDYRLGAVERVRRRMPGARISVVSFIPVTDLDAADGRSRRKLGDWVVFTLATPKP